MEFHLVKVHEVNQILSFFQMVDNMNKSIAMLFKSNLKT